MIEEQAIVTGVRGNKAMLQIERSQPCGLCGSTQGCGMSLLGRLFASRKSGLSVENVLNLNAGERVIIGMQEGGLLASALFAYLPPLGLLLLGAWLGTAVARSGTSAATHDAYAVLGALLGLLLGFALTSWLGSGGWRAGSPRPVMLRRTETAPANRCSKNFRSL